MSAATVLDRQVATLLDLDYPALSGLTTSDFTDRLEPLRAIAAHLPDLPEHDEPGRSSLVLVVTRELVDPELTVPLLRLAPHGTAPGILDRNHGEAGLAPYRPILNAAPTPRGSPWVRRGRRRGSRAPAATGSPRGA